MTGFNPTDEQQAIIQAVRQDKRSLLIQAYAGAAKTTTLVLAAQEIRQAALALAFNKSIKEELAKRLPPSFRVSTLNGLGYGALRRALPAASFKIDDRKLGRLVSTLSKEWKMNLSGDQWSWAREMASQAQQSLLIPEGAPGQGFVEDSAESWEEICSEVPREEREYLLDFVREILRRDIQEALQGNLSFDDQIYISLCVAGRFVQYPVVLVDEAQDLSEANIEMIRRSLRDDGRIVACGDQLQSIYAFRGADHESIEKLKRLRPEWIELPLTMTFRVPEEIVKRQLWHAKGFRAAASNARGRFVELTEDWEWGQVQEIAGGRPVTVLCRNNAPLLGLAFRLIRQRTGVKMAGREIGKGLTTLAKKILPSEGDQIQLAQAITDWQTTEASLARANGKEKLVDGIDDRAECLRAVLSFSNSRQELLEQLEKIFSSEGSQVLLSSIHKAKGLEWPVVMLLDPWRLPSKRAREAAKSGDSRELKQENNLKYVAETRTKEVLIHANLDGMIRGEEEGEINNLGNQFDVANHSV